MEGKGSRAFYIDVARDPVSFLTGPASPGLSRRLAGVESSMSTTQSKPNGPRLAGYRGPLVAALADENQMEQDATAYLPKLVVP
jgi:hypothetical protein